MSEVSTQSVYSIDISSLNKNKEEGNQQPKAEETPQQDNKPQAQQEQKQEEQVEQPNQQATSNEQSETKDNKNTEPQQEKSEEVDIDSLVNERINQLKESGEFIEKSAYEKALEEREIKNDLIKKLAELDKGTGKVNKDFLRQYLTDWDSYDITDIKQARKLISEKLMQAEGFDKETAELELEAKYPALFEEYPDTESREYQRQLKLAQHEAKKFIAEQKSQQESLALSDPEQLQAVDRNKVIEEYTQEQAQKQQEIFDAWKDYSESVVEKTGKLVHEVDGNQFEVNMTDDEKKALKDLVGNTPRLPDLFFKDGKLDEQSYQDFILYGLMGRRVAQATAKDAIAMGEAKKFKETKSATSTSSGVIDVAPDKTEKVKNILSKYGIPS